MRVIGPTPVSILFFLAAVGLALAMPRHRAFARADGLRRWIPLALPLALMMGGFLTFD